MVTALPRVMVLEDDEIMLELYRCHFDLWALPVKCIWMSSATDALRDIDSLRPQLLITDLSMPGVDGLQMLQELESRPHLGDMKIVVVSGVQSEVIAARDGLSPRIDFLRKPVDFSWLRRCVKALVQCPQT
jgi:DNA-binding NtrC family response regulator